MLLAFILILKILFKVSHVLNFRCCHLSPLIFIFLLFTTCEVLIIIHLLSYPHLLLAARISKVYLYIFKSKLTSAGFNAHS